MSCEPDSFVDGPSRSRREILSVFRERLQLRVSPREFEIWFRSTPYELEPPSTILLTTHNQFRRKWIEKEFGTVLLETATEVLGASASLEFRVLGVDETATSLEPPKDPDANDPASTAPQEVSAQDILDEARASAGTDSGRGPRRPSAADLLDDFVVGAGSRVAVAAALAVTEHPGRTYNPLVLHGPTGVGKTHLLRGIRERLEATANLRIRYITAESFTNDFLEAVDSRSVDDFVSALQAADVLLVDGIQFFCGKAKTVDVFRDLVAELLEGHRQVVLSCDRQPGALSDFPERLVSTMRHGLVAALERPEFSARVEIVRRKALRRGVEIDPVVAEFLAQQGFESARELEGALIQVLARASLLGVPPSLDIARSALLEADSASPSLSSAVSVDSIRETLLAYYDVSTEDLLSPSKVRSVVLARQIGMYLARELTALSLEQIGRQFGGRDHSTVLYAQRRIREKRRSNPRVEADLQLLRERIIARHSP